MVSIQEILQKALINAIQERFAKHELVQNYESQLVQLRANVKKAENERLAVASARETAEQNYQELLNYCNNQEQHQRSSLNSELERLSQEVNTATVRLRTADDTLRHARTHLQQIEQSYAVAQSNLNLATERWEQIRKQLDDARSS